ncbi:hypothetical protein ABH892_005255 [Paenibacillus sp. RC254]|uniref:hypothetical protein n=1 Tax=unclassified Paenibacillus TaxID=185978 RepID=UPI0024BBB1A6|nr:MULTISPECIES: hypothetical protein [unclassified Paenibacillus]
MKRKNLMICAIIVLIVVSYLIGNSKDTEVSSTSSQFENDTQITVNSTVPSDQPAKVLNQSQSVTKPAKSTAELKPLFAGPLQAFKDKYGTPDSKYMFSISYNQDDLLIDSDNESGMVNSISMSFSNETFINKENALAKILPYLPKDAKKIKSRVDGESIFVLYQSPSTAETFSDWYEAWGSEALKKHGGGMILVQAIGGDPNSKERRGNVTTARMELCSLSVQDIKDIDVDW